MRPDSWDSGACPNIYTERRQWRHGVTGGRVLKILLVEDSERLQRSISTGLRGVGHVIDQAFDGSQALAFTSTYDYDAIILDLMLPGIDGLTVLKALRQRQCNSSVLILSARDQTDDRILGLDMGADDYLVKPFSFDELVARLNALSRRHTDYTTNILDVGQLQIDTAIRQVKYGDRVITVTPTEYALLECLVRKRGNLVRHEQLIDQLYDATASITKNTLEAHISSLRKKLKHAGAPELVVTRRGYGYIIEKS